MTSCEDYLDKAPESSVNPEDAFKNFRNFQGFTEELYYCIPDFAHGYWNNSFNWGEDELISFSIDYHISSKSCSPVEVISGIPARLRTSFTASRAPSSSPV